MTRHDLRRPGEMELDVLGLRVHMVQEAEALARIERMHEHGPPSYVSYVNPHTANLAYGDPAFRSAVAGAQLRLPDGFGLRVAARRQGVPVPAILNGSDFNAAVLRRAAARGWSVFLLGARPGIAARAGERLQRRIPGLQLAGAHHGYFDDAEAHAVADRVRASGASVLMVALGQPRQEHWLERHLPATGVRVGLAVGGFLDFAAGEVRRAPPWMNRAGLEWTFRLAQEPTRLAHRYLVGNLAFIWRVCRAGTPRPTTQRVLPDSPEMARFAVGGVLKPAIRD
jgi:exopolysaccharide biosynthesis WecB/TagA/CpsF family protein